MKYLCPYCTKEMPSGYEWQTWACCGEVGHAVACNYDDNEGVCTADTSNDDNGERCAVCEAEYQAEAAHYGALWNGGMREIYNAERDPEAYRQSMIDAGRGHLVK